MGQGGKQSQACWVNACGVQVDSGLRFFMRATTQTWARTAGGIDLWLGQPVWRLQPLPARPEAWQSVMNGSYNTAPFWNRLHSLCDPDCTLGRLDSPSACSAGWLKNFLQHMGQQDQRAASDRGIAPSAWPEAEQRSPANQPYIVAALAASVRQSCPVAESAELQRFLRVAEPTP